MTDHITYDPGFGPAGSLAHALWIRAKLRHVFDFRREKIAALFPAPAR